MEAPVLEEKTTMSARRMLGAASETTSATRGRRFTGGAPHAIINKTARRITWHHLSQNGYGLEPKLLRKKKDKLIYILLYKVIDIDIELTEVYVNS